MAWSLEGPDPFGVSLAHFLDGSVIVKLLVGPEPDDPADVANRKKWVGAVKSLPGTVARELAHDIGQDSSAQDDGFDRGSGSSSASKPYKVNRTVKCEFSFIVILSASEESICESIYYRFFTSFRMTC